MWTVEWKASGDWITDLGGNRSIDMVCKRENGVFH
jgi:hypothetical protein